MDKRETTLDGVKDKMLNEMMQYDMRNRRLHGWMDYKFESEKIFHHNRLGEAGSVRLLGSNCL